MGPGFRIQNSLVRMRGKAGQESDEGSYRLLPWLQSLCYETLPINVRSRDGARSVFPRGSLNSTSLPSPAVSAIAAHLVPFLEVDLIPLGSREPGPSEGAL